MADSRLDLLQGTLDMLLLKALQVEPLHGYAIARRVQQLSEDALRVEEGSLYPALHRIEERGFVESDWGTSENNRRAKYYRLTRAGRKRLEAEAGEWKRLSLAITRVMEA
ncbi:MAG: PadR family transcriptional regulator [Burkholderiales bacterium]|jgi:transcriptional regulator